MFTVSNYRMKIIILTIVAILRRGIKLQTAQYLLSEAQTIGVICFTIMLSTTVTVLNAFQPTIYSSRCLFVRFCPFVCLSVSAACSAAVAFVCLFVFLFQLSGGVCLFVCLPVQRLWRLFVCFSVPAQRW